jgi:hypothetical protein
MPSHNMNAGLPRAFRSYRAFVDQVPDCTIWEALCAIMAHPDPFKGITIGGLPVKESFLDGALGGSNPLAHILSEVKLMYPNRHIGCIISIGSGHARTIHIPRSSPFQHLLPTNVVEVMKALAAGSERVAEDMAIRFSGIPGVYFRFNVDQGMQGVKLDDGGRLHEVAAHTRAYMQRIEESKMIDEAAIAIRRKAKGILAVHVGT